MYRRDEPSALFHFLHHAHRRRVYEEQARRGLGDMGAPMILLTLFRGEQEGCQLSQRDLARQLRLSPATVAVSLKPLERDGYLVRTADERDARRNLVDLTEKGRRAVELCGEAFRAVDDQMLAGFSEQEKTQLDGFFTRMLENLGVNAEDVPPPPPRRSGKGDKRL